MATPDRNEAPEFGRDPLDPVSAPGLWAQWFPTRHVMLGIAPTAAPAVSFILIGVLVGPEGLGLLSGEVVARLSPAVSVGLAALGVFVGLALGTSLRRGHGGLLGAALIEVLTTLIVVAPILFLLLTLWAVPIAESTALFALAAGVCSSASAATGERPGPLTRLARIVDLDDGPVVLVGAIVVAVAAGRDPVEGLGLTAAAGVSIGLAGWLLFERARGIAERGVFVVGVVALLGGAAAYLSMSPLLSGAIAALVWVWSPGGADRLIADDLRKLQHPLIALLLIVAGASIQWTLGLLWIVGPLVLLRLMSKLTASLVVSRIVGVPPGRLATILLPPGVIGIALALNVHQVGPGTDTLLLSAVTVSTGLAEVLAVLLASGPPGGDA